MNAFGKGIMIASAVASLIASGTLMAQVTYDHCFAARRAAARYLEVPFVATPSIDVNSQVATLPRNSAARALMPSLQVKFQLRSTLAPWLSADGDYSRFAESHTLINGSPNIGATATNKAAAQFPRRGGHQDSHQAAGSPIGLRAEMRDFHSGKPNLKVNTEGGFQHKLVYSGGLVLRF